LVGESLLKRQQDDPDVGVIVRHRLATDEVPTREELETESETTKKLATKWESLEVHGGLVYQSNESEGWRARLPTVSVTTKCLLALECLFPY